MSTDPASDAQDPIRQLLHTPPASVGSLRPPSWAGIGGLVGIIVLAAIAIPPLLIPPRSDGGSTAVPAPVTPSRILSAPTTSPPSTAQPSRGLGSDQTATPTNVSHGAPGSPGRQTSRTTPPAASWAAKQFSPISVQAEDPRNRFTDGAAVAFCDSCDGGGRVRYLGTLIVYVDLPASGGRTVTVTYQTDGKRHLQIKTDNRSWLFEVQGTSWYTPKTLTFNAFLPAGRVELMFHNEDHVSPDIDEVTIS